MRFTITRLFTLLAAVVLLAGCSDDANDTDKPSSVVSVTTDGHGGAAASVGDVTVTRAEQESIVTLTATPDNGYGFSQWVVESGGVRILSPTINPAVFVMPGHAVSISAEFVAVPTYVLSLTNDGNGEASAEFSRYSADQVIEITATADEGYRFDKWVLVNGGVAISSATDNPATFTMPSNAVTIKATFKVKPLSVFNAEIAATDADAVVDNSFGVKPGGGYGDGSETDPYLITSALELRALIQRVNESRIGYSGKYFLLTTDIHVDDDVEWSPAGDYGNNGYFSFYGHFDGGGSTVSGRLEGSGTDFGFFGDMRGSVSNLTVSADVVNNYNGGSTCYTGGIAGYSFSSITNCTVSGNVTGGNSTNNNNCYTGGIAGYSYDSPITDCTVSGDITGGNSTGNGTYTGGISGLSFSSSSSSSSITGCTVSGDVAGGNATNGNSNTGGIAGYSDSSITGCTVSGDVTGGNSTNYYSNTGGIAGSSSSSSITGCTVSGDITGGTCGGGEAYSDAGGIAGYNGGYIHTSLFTGNVAASAANDAKPNYIGGIAGYNYEDWGYVYSCNTFDGTVSGNTGSVTDPPIGTEDYIGHGNPAESSCPESHTAPQP